MAHDHCHCKDYSRSELMRHAAAQAGNGLPAIENGMPVPAGTGLSRRTFLSRSAGLALAVYGATKIPLAAFEEGIAHAATPPKVLVSIFFDGGIDALNVLAPVNDSTYHTLRPTIGLHLNDAQPPLSFTEDSNLFWHPSAASLRALHRQSRRLLPTVLAYRCLTPRPVVPSRLPHTAIPSWCASLLSRFPC